MEVSRVLDARLTQLDPAPVPLGASISAARAALRAGAARLMTIPDDALERPWPAQGEGDSDVRSAVYLAVMELQEATGRVGAALVIAGLHPGPAAGAVAAATRARWDLHGLLEPLGEGPLDADPGTGEWSIRRTLGHVLASQRSYAWFSGWWLGRAGEADLPPRADEAHAEPLPSEEEEASGPSAELRARLDALLDLSAWLWLPADESAWATPARWSGFPVTVGFRAARWAAHLAEHTIQVEKTLVMLGRPTSEVERLHRLFLRAYGDLEAPVLSFPGDELGASVDGTDLPAPLVEGVTRAVALVDSAVAISRAGPG